MKYTIENQRLELEFSLSKSNVVIQEGEDSEVELDFTGLRKKTAEELFTIGFRNNRLFVKENSGKHPPVMDALFNSGTAGDVVLKIPKGTSLSGKIASIKGDIKAGSLNFHGELRTVMGKIVVENLTSDGVDIQNVGGSIVITSFEGFIKGKTVAGEFAVEDGSFKGIAVRSVSGDINLTGDFQLEEESDISTVSGNVHLNVKQMKDEHKLSISTLSGSSSIVGEYPEGTIVIKPRMPFLKNHPFKHFAPGMKDMFSSFFNYSKKHEGEGEVEVETASESSENQQKNTKMILEMLSQGKITVEDAERLIKALGGKQS